MSGAMDTSVGDPITGISATHVETLVAVGTCRSGFTTPVVIGSSGRSPTPADAGAELLAARVASAMIAGVPRHSTNQQSIAVIASSAHSMALERQAFAISL